MKKTSSVNGAFTLIELLVVIAIIAILAAILFPVFAQAKTAAKRTSDLSNTKQLTLGVIMYTNDSDDIMPIFRTVVNGGDWWKAAMYSWKDSTSPYIKSGDRPYNNGIPYTTPGSTSVFQSPMADQPWSDISPLNWGWPLAQGPGDETTRFPRGYSLNQDLGRNEGGGPLANGPAPGIIADWEVNALQGRPGSTSQLSKVADDLLIVSQRPYFTGAWVAELGYTCDASGNPGGSNQLSCIQSTHNHNITGGFADGHAKNVSGPASATNDNWDALDAYEAYQPGYKQNLTTAIQAIPEWTK